jgi:hypothetical protein
MAELAILLGLKIVKDLAFVLLDFSMYQTVPSAILAWALTQSLILIFPVTTEALLSLYLIKRLLSGKAVLTKWTFLLAFTVFVALFAQLFLNLLVNLIQFSTLIPFPSFRDIILGLAYYGVLALAAIFSVRTFMALRGGGEFELVLPHYLRISVIFYALVYGAYEVWNLYFTLYLAFSFSLSHVALMVLDLLFYVGLITLCLFPPRFIAGEVSTTETIHELRA